MKWFKKKETKLENGRRGAYKRRPYDGVIHQFTCDDCGVETAWTCAFPEPPKCRGCDSTRVTEGAPCFWYPGQEPVGIPGGAVLLPGQTAYIRLRPHNESEPLEGE